MNTDQDQSLTIDMELEQQWGMFSYTPEEESERVISEEGYSSLVNYKLFQAKMDEVGLKASNVLYSDRLEDFKNAYAETIPSDQLDEIIKVLRDDPEYSNEYSNGYVSVNWNGKTQGTDTEREKDQVNDDSEGGYYDENGELNPITSLKGSHSWAISEQSHEYFVYGLTHWKHGFFIPSSFEKHETKHTKARRYFGITSECLTNSGNVRKRKAETKPRRARAPRKAKAIAYGKRMAHANRNRKKS